MERDQYRLLLLHNSKSIKTTAWPEPIQNIIELNQEFKLSQFNVR